MYAVRAALLEGYAGLAFSARLHIGARMFAVYCLREDSGGTGLSHAPRTAEQICVREFSPNDGILQSLYDIILANEILK